MVLLPFLRCGFVCFLRLHRRPWSSLLLLMLAPLVAELDAPRQVAAIMVVPCHRCLPVRLLPSVSFCLSTSQCVCLCVCFCRCLRVYSSASGCLSLGLCVMSLSLCLSLCLCLFLCPSVSVCLSVSVRPCVVCSSQDRLSLARVSSARTPPSPVNDTTTPPASAAPHPPASPSRASPDRPPQIPTLSLAARIIGTTIAD